MITVILPCAGEGTRLSLPYPKEVHSIEKNKSLIDYSFDLFSNYGRRDVQFVVTLTEDKTDIIKYLSRYKSRFNISFTFFNPAETEYTGSIKSAKHLFGEKNLVLLPDTYLKLKSSQDIVNLVSESLNETGFTFFYKKENNKEEPPMILRVIWAISLGVIAIVLLAGGGIGALQTSVIVTGVPFAILVSFAARSLLKSLNQ